MEIIVIIGRRVTAASSLIAELSEVEVSLLNGNIIERHLELLGDDHRERGFYALAHFGLFGDNSYLPRAGNADEGVGREIS